MRSLVTWIVASCASLALWVSFGTLAVTSADPGAARIGVLPPLWTLALAAVVVVSAVVALRRRGLSAAPLLLSGLILLPWLPVPVPSAFLIWTGPMVVAVWIATLAALVAAHRWRRASSPSALVLLVRDPARAPIVAAIVATAGFSLAAWGAAPMVPGGDEPHYLIITQSLLQDFDLQIENNHKQRDFQAYVNLPELKPDYLVRGKNGAIYSIHAPGLSVLVAPAFAVAGYPGVKVFLILLSALGSALAWRLAWRITGDPTAAWFGWAAVFGSTTWVFHAFSVYPDGPGGLAMLVGIWLILKLETDEASPGRGACLLAGGALATLPWLHSRFVLLSGPLGLLVVLALARKRPWREAARLAAAFLVLPVISALGWFAYFSVIYGTIDPLAPYGTLIEAGSRMDQIPDGTAGLLFDQQFGLLPHAPALVAVLVGLVFMLRDRPWRPIGLAVLSTALVYLLSVTHYRMWWGGWSAPARFMSPLLPALTLPAAVAWVRCRSRTNRSLFVAALVVTLVTTTALVWVERGRLAFNVRDGYALWFQWLSPLADLTFGLPTFFRTTEAISFVQVGIWLAVGAAAWLLLRGGERAIKDRAAWATTVTAVLALGAMAGSSLVWRSSGATGLSVTPAQLDLLNAAARDTGVGVEFRPIRRLDVSSVSARLSIESPLRYLQSSDRPLFVLPRIPAGSYALHLETVPDPPGVIQPGIAREDWALRTVPLRDVAGSGSGTLALDFPVDVRALVVRGDEASHRAVRRMTLVPVALLPPSRRIAEGRATRAIGYPGGAVYFMDDGTFVEPSAFWVRGGRTARVVFVPAGGSAAGGGGRMVPVFVRNAPVENRLVIEAGRWREDIALRPGEERAFSIPLAPGQTATLVRFQSEGGFRPSEVEPGSQDTRFLGVWVTVR